MALASFKTPCPSCEGLVLVKDGSMIGKKIDCPKCKYRFVVEDPRARDKAAVEGAADEDVLEDVEIAEEQPKKAAPTAVTAKAKAGAKPAAPAKANGKPAVKGKAAAKRPADDDEDEDEDRPKKKKKKGGSNKMVLGLVLAGVGVAVLAVAAFLVWGRGDSKKKTNTPPQQAGKTPENNPGDQNLDPKKDDKAAGAVQPAAKVVLAQPGTELTNLLPAKSQHVLHLFFGNLVQSPLGDVALQPAVFPDEDFKQRLGFSPRKIDDLIRAESYAEHWAFTVVHVHEILSESAVKEALGLESAAGSPIHGQSFYKVTRHNAWLEELGRLSLGTVAPLRATLAKAEERPLLVRFHDPQTLVFADVAPMQEFLGRGPQKKAKPAKAPEGEQAQGGGERPGRGRPARGGMQVAPVEGAAPAGEAGKDGAPAGPYAHLNPALRAMLEKVEKPSADAPAVLLFSAVTDLDAARIDSRIPGRVAWRFRSVWDVTHALPDNPQRAHVLGASLTRRAQNEPSTYAYQNEIDCGSDGEAKSLHKDLQDKVAPDLARFFERLTGLKIDVPKDEPADPQGAAAPPARIEGRAPPLITGARPGVGPSRGVPPGPRGVPAATAPGPDAAKADPAKSRITITQTDKAVTFTLNLVLTEEASARLRAAAELVVYGFKGELELAGGTPLRHDLAAAVKQLGEQGIPDKGVTPGHYPQGVFARTDTKARLARDPGQRVSWMAGLLPLLRQDPVYARIRFDRSWKDPDNWMAARTLVPEFLDPTYPAAARFAPYPGIPVPLGGTHFVGIAGIGQDAPEYSASDPAVVTKLGVFGYDRMTPLEEIQKNRGLSNTAVVVQVPHNGPAGVTPWMAGGGSTIRGVPEKDSVKPFVSTTHDGKRGTFVLMADGAVRFVAEDVKDDIFKAMSTYKGPTPDFFDVDRDAPQVKGKARPLAPAVARVEPAIKSGPASMEWQEVTSKEGGFSVKMPGTPQTINQPLPTGGQVMIYLAPLEEKKMLFSAHCQDIPANELTQGPDAVFKAFQVGFMASMKGATMKKETPITLGKNPGRQYDLESPGQGAGIVRVYLANQHLYGLQVLAADLNAAAGDMKTFFDSFKLLNGAGDTASAQPDEKKAAAPEGWQEYVSNEGGYSVNLPGKPRTGVQRLPPQMGGATVYVAAVDTATAKNKKDKKEIAVAYLDVPPEIKSIPLDQQFAMYRQMMAGKLTGVELKNEKEVKLGEHPGQEVELKAGKGSAFLRIYLVDSRVYMMLVAGPGLSDASPEVHGVFDSFQLLPQGAKGKGKGGR